MTCINQYMKEHPDATLSEVIKNYCPCEFYNIDENFEGCTDETWGDCKSCWDREIPEDKKEKNVMTCRQKLIAEHPEWSELIIMKCTDIFTPNEYFAIDGPELLWSDIYPCDVEECSECSVTEEEKRELVELFKDYETRLMKANEEIETLKGCIEVWNNMREELIHSLNDTDKRLLDTMNELNKKEEELVKLKEEFEYLDAESDRQDKKNTELRNKLPERVQTIEEQQEKIKLRDEEIDKLVKENDILTKQRDVFYHEYSELKCAIEKMGFTVNADNEVITPLHRPHVMTEAEYIECDLEVAKKVADHYKSLAEEPSIRPINELPYVRYAGHIHMKYKALVDNGFSHDDAMALIPMWDDNEFEGFKHRERDA